MSNKGPIPFHIPDSTWDAFNIKTYEEYLSKVLVKSAFHSGVHEDVLKSYTIYEHLTAHAWYSYPSLDDAYTKLLFITEMAIKLRCEQLGIELKEIRNGVSRNIPLKTLISKIPIVKLNPEFEQSLDHIRNLRNSIAHPDRFTFGFGLLGHVKPIVAALNILFLDETYLRSCIIERDRMQKEVNKMSNKCFVIQNNEQTYICWKISVLYALKVKNTWHYALMVSPVDQNAYVNFSDNAYMQAIGFYAVNIKITSEVITFWDEINQESLRIVASTVISDELVWNEYLMLKDNHIHANTINVLSFNSLESGNFGKHKFNFLYDKMHLIH